MGAVILLGIGFGPGFVPLAASAQTAKGAGLVTAEARAMTPTLDAYARVEPISLLTVSAMATGVVAGLSVVPGMHVRAGQELAHLSGPELEAMLSQARYSVATAQTQLTTAEKVLATQRQQFASQLTTRQAVNQAEGAAEEAKTTLNSAQSRLHAALQMTTMVAPSEAIVLALNSTDGALVNVGQPILTLQPANRLQLTATYYGAEIMNVRAGMTGTFVPSDGNAAIPVKVSAVLGAVTAGGGASIAMVPAKRGMAAPHWIGGEFGRVTLDLPKRSMVAIPTRALILDQGKWWVMVHTPKGDRPQEVVPGSADGWDTFIEQGLQPGAQIVVENAYLLFHQGITQTFQIPD
jgi:RND family efflux transporter MFP subunit